MLSPGESHYDHGDKVHAYVAQADPNEDISELVASLWLTNDISEAPQVISEKQQCAVIEEFEQIRNSRLHRHVP